MEDVCYDLCPLGYYSEAETNICLECSQNCLKCSSNIVCTLCDEGNDYYLENNMCVFQSDDPQNPNPPGDGGNSGDPDSGESPDQNGNGEDETPGDDNSSNPLPIVTPYCFLSYLN